MVTAVRKITVREMLKGRPDREEIEIINESGEKTKKMVAKVQDLCLVAGSFHTIESGSSQYGPYTIFIGRAQGRRIKDGEIFQSTRVIFPQIAEDIALNYFLDAKAQDETAAVEMAFMIGAEPDTRGQEGYKFTIRPISTGPRAPDPLDDLMARISGEVSSMLPAETLAKLALPAPKETVDQETGEVQEPGTAQPKGSKSSLKETSAA